MFRIGRRRHRYYTHLIICPVVLKIQTIWCVFPKLHILIDPPCQSLIRARDPDTRPDALRMRLALEQRRQTHRNSDRIGSGPDHSNLVILRLDSGSLTSTLPVYISLA